MDNYRNSKKCYRTHLYYSIEIGRNYKSNEWTANVCAFMGNLKSQGYRERALIEKDIKTRSNLATSKNLFLFRSCNFR